MILPTYWAHPTQIKRHKRQKTKRLRIFKLLKLKPLQMRKLLLIFSMLLLAVVVSLTFDALELNKVPSLKKLLIIACFVCYQFFNISVNAFINEIKKQNHE